MNSYVLMDLGQYWLEQSFIMEKRLKKEFHKQILFYNHRYQADILAYLKSCWTPTALKPIFDLIERIGLKSERNPRKICYYLTFSDSFYDHVYGRYYTDPDRMTDPNRMNSSHMREFYELTQKLIAIFKNRFEGYIGYGSQNKLFYLSHSYHHKSDELRMINKFHLRIKEDLPEGFPF